MKPSHLYIPALLAFCFFCDPSPTAVAQTPASSVEFFESRIRPLLHEHCVSCHGPEKQEGDLRLDTPRAILKGGDTGAAITPRESSASLIVAAVRQLDVALQMPPAPAKKLSEQEVADLVAWIDAGAMMPDLDGVDSEMTKRPPRFSDRLEKGKGHWSFQPIVRPAIPLPAIDTSEGNNAEAKAREANLSAIEAIRNPIDAFILQTQMQHGLSINEATDRSAWLRRVTIGLTGLPPTAEELERFLSDRGADAIDRVVDRLLSSAQYGERWGRFWLDVVRYSDSNGLDENIAHGTAWRYRNYVIDSLNEDKPYSDFLSEQIAGDLLPYSSREQRNSQVTATAFLALGPKVLAEVDEKKMEMDIVDEQIDTIGKAFLAITLGCARCHDHKFDPISTEDYYGLAGVFKSTHTMESFTKIAKWHENVIASEQQESELASKQAELSALKTRLEELTKQSATDAEKQSLTAKIEQLQKSMPVLPTVMGVREGEVQDVPVHVRGSHLVLASKVERRFPEVLSLDRKPIGNATQSGRLELTRWMTDPRNPLTARVIVNRLWRWHFGRGLVASTDNFGELGEKPTHPELLDWLACELIDSCWSIKHIQRLIVTSVTYGQSSRIDEAKNNIDPENRYLWRFPVRRLEAEAIRDTLLASCGQLDRARGTSLLHVGNREFLFDHTSIDKTKYDSPLRSIYLPVIRNHLYDLFDLFDYSDAATVQGDRGSTTVAPQALFMLNSALVHDAAANLVKELLKQPGLDDKGRVQRMYALLYGRYPTDGESEAMLKFLEKAGDVPREQRWIHLCQAAIASNDFLYVR